MNLSKLNDVVKEAILSALPNNFTVIIDIYEHSTFGTTARIEQIFESRADAFLYAEKELEPIVSKHFAYERVARKSVKYPMPGELFYIKAQYPHSFETELLVVKWSKQKLAQAMFPNLYVEGLLNYRQYSEQPENSPPDTSVA